MHHISIELTDTFDGRTRRYTGRQLFAWKGKRYGRFTYKLFDKGDVKKVVEYVIPLVPDGTDKIYVDGVIDHVQFSSGLDKDG